MSRRRGENGTVLPTITEYLSLSNRFQKTTLSFEKSVDVVNGYRNPSSYFLIFFSVHKNTLSLIMATLFCFGKTYLPRLFQAEKLPVAGKERENTGYET